MQNPPLPPHRAALTRSGYAAASARASAHPFAAQRRHRDTADAHEFVSVVADRPGSLRRRRMHRLREARVPKPRRPDYLWH